MLYNSLELSLITISAFSSFFITLIVEKNSAKLFNGSLLDQDFKKPQSFHSKPVARSGGLAAIVSLGIFYIISFFFFRI